MNERLQHALVEEFPGVLRYHGGEPQQTCMAWGIACGDGWFLILWELCRELERLAERARELDPDLGVTASQVKEKFGTLRFYLNAVHADVYDEVHTLVDRAEKRSAVTCEYCGRPGRQVNPRGWVRTLCEECQP